MPCVLKQRFSGSLLCSLKEMAGLKSKSPLVWGGSLIPSALHLLTCARALSHGSPPLGPWEVSQASSTGAWCVPKEPRGQRTREHGSLRRSEKAQGTRGETGLK